jgi:alanine-synthesizing transaminase
MKIYDKAERLNDVSYAIRGPVMQEAQRMMANGISVLRLNIGNPAVYGFRAPKAVSDAFAACVADTQGYSESKGLLTARNAILRYCRKKNIPCASSDDIYTGNGVSELILTTMQALINDGDEILVPCPNYPLWTSAIVMNGGKAVSYICDESSEWYPDIEDMRRKITPKTKGILVINPNNPTGALYPREILEKITDLAREHHLILFADEIYDRTVMDGHEHVALASLAPDLLTLSYNGLSKSHFACGMRSGWMCICGNKEGAEGFLAGINLLASTRLCSNVPGQAIIPTAMDECLEDIKEHILPGGRLYEQREAVCKGLADIPGVSVVKPKGALYVFPKVDIKRFGFESDEQFAFELLREKHIIVTHGSGFNMPTSDHFRIAYLPEADVLTDACRKIGEFLGKRAK